MSGDIVIVEDIHVKKAELIYPKIISKYSGKKMVVAISGISGIGKTEIASVLQKNLFDRHKIRTKVIHTDDYYKSNFLERDDIRKETGIIGKEEIDWNKLNGVIRIFRSNLPKLYVRRIHKFLNSTEYCISNNRCIDILIVEGLYGNYLDDKDFSIFLDGNIDQTSEFRKKRDKENLNDDFRRLVLEIEEEDVKLSRKYSEMVIPFEIN